MQSRKDKINSKDITEMFLFSLFDSSVMTQVVEEGVRQKFPIWTVSPKLGTSELWSKGVWVPALKGPNWVRAHFDRPGIKATICKINSFFIVTIICPK